ncbi:hypothetical protein NDU88_002654 [Pleurodeles waltl]|uniref:Uncharacterized protein n=1 Tax=Pleurodeles waltl TaxID=8319 RepID=A0AAV7Q9H9_PLEWA|nr:hypothetical protein NDU88_002654 [Pleurodeles waltl]
MSDESKVQAALWLLREAGRLDILGKRGVGPIAPSMTCIQRGVGSRPGILCPAHGADEDYGESEGWGRGRGGSGVTTAKGHGGGLVARHLGLHSMARARRARLRARWSGSEPLNARGRVEGLDWGLMCDDW